MNLNSKDITDDFQTQKIYLNNASVGLMPKIAIDEMKEFLISYNSLGPDSSNSKPVVDEILRKTRKTIAKIVNCQPDEIILTQSTTDGINEVANGMNFSSNSNIIIRDSSHEHHANYYPWLRLKKNVKIKNLPIDENGYFDLDDLEKSLDNNTTLVVLSHALYNTGSILPLKEVGKILGDIPFFVDSAQTVGCIGDFDFAELNSNFMSFNGSKWLCGPMGTGLFFCERKSSELLNPTYIGGESAMIYDETNLAYKELPDKFQTGFRNYVGMVGLYYSANYLLQYGLDNIRKKNINLSNFLIKELEKINGVTVLGPEDPKQRTSIVSFVIDNFDPEYVVEKLEKQDIILAVREIKDKKIIRASPHFYNTDNDIQKVVDAIKKL
ncbi:MAG: aminotransferase class V-fold PLP-dependent enzyme [Nitrosopumilaceae archaeon]|nr:aminotransferase class V-fold PLP-dependent enzyme [Nitrosopumilaceae archaeon]